MSGKAAKGKVSQRQKVYFKIDIEYTIKDIFSYTKVDEVFNSPAIFVSGSEWYLRIYPKSATRDNSVECIGLYLFRGSSESIHPKEVNFSLGIKKVDGAVEVVKSDLRYVFRKKHLGVGFSQFLQRSRLLERKSELAPSGALTITCTMRMQDDMDFSTERLMELSLGFKKMYVSEKDCDALLKVQNQEFPVHKSVLASQSSVFERMFEVDMKEKNTGIVEIVDCDPEAFIDFLVYVYTGWFEISSGDAVELYKIAHKYCTEELKSACVRSILSNLSVDKVIDAAILGDQFDVRELESKSQDVFNKNFAAVIATDKWNLLLRQKPSLANQLLNNMAKNMKIREKKVLMFFEKFRFLKTFFN